MKTLIIPDIHNRVQWIEPFLASQIFNEVVFLGDYNDSDKDTVIDARRTSEWVRHSIHQPGRIHLIGNHDLFPYFGPVDKYGRSLATWMSCAGNRKRKTKEVRKILTPEMLRRLKMMYQTQGWVLSHAGISEYHFAHPILGYQGMERKCEEALEKAKIGIYDPILVDGYARGGHLPVGGILWQDATHEFKPIEDMNQVFGHSWAPEPRVWRAKNSENWCIDTESRYYGIIEDGKFSYARTPLP